MKFMLLLIFFASSISFARVNYNVASMRGVVVATDDTTDCFPERLTGFINELRTRFGSLRINSAYRSARHNRQVGGARGSQHLSCNAIDFSVPGVSKAEVRQFLIANFMDRGGIGFYCGNRFHLDVGRVRQWGGCQPGSSEIRTAQARYRQYIANRDRQNPVRVSSQRTSHEGYHRHVNDHRIFVQRSAL